MPRLHPATSTPWAIFHCSMPRTPVSRPFPGRRSKSWPFTKAPELGFRLVRVVRQHVNYDLHVTLDETIAPAEYNYRSKADRIARELTGALDGEGHGLSVFFRIGKDVYHTYSAYARGTESLTDAYRLLDLTPYGRQQKFEDSPDGLDATPDLWVRLPGMTPGSGCYGQARVGTFADCFVSSRWPTSGDFRGPVGQQKSPSCEGLFACGCRSRSSQLNPLRHYP